MTLGFLRRNILLFQEVKEAAYSGLMRQVLEYYGSSVWDPHVQFWRKN